MLCTKPFSFDFPTLRTASTFFVPLFITFVTAREDANQCPRQRNWETRDKAAHQPDKTKLRFEVNHTHIFDSFPSTQFLHTTTILACWAPTNPSSQASPTRTHLTQKMGAHTHTRTKHTHISGPEDVFSYTSALFNLVFAIVASYFVRALWVDGYYRCDDFSYHWKHRPSSFDACAVAGIGWGLLVIVLTAVFFFGRILGQRGVEVRRRESIGGGLNS